MRELWRAGQSWRDLTGDVRHVAASRRTVVLVTEHGTIDELDFERGRWLRAPARGGRPERRRFAKIDFVTSCGAAIVEDTGNRHDTDRLLLAAVGHLSDPGAEAAPASWGAPGHPPEACPALRCPHRNQGAAGGLRL